MDNSFYGQSGYEPWEVCDTAERVVESILYAHLCYVGGAIKPAERIKELISTRYADGVRYSYSCGGPHGDLAEDIVYNLRKFLENKTGEHR